jgi:hypothetical protein
MEKKYKDLIYSFPKLNNNDNEEINNIKEVNLSL